MYAFWARYLSPTLVISNKLFLGLISVVSLLLAVAVIQLKPNPMEQWLHDRIATHNLRSEWKDTALVVLDERVPFSLGRDESLTLYALAMERLAEMGASRVFLDANISLKNYRKTAFAQCITDIGTIKRCSVSSQNSQCLTHKGEKRTAPLDLDTPVWRRLLVPEPLTEYSPPPLFHLFGRSSEVGDLGWVDVSLPKSSDGILREVYAGPDSLPGSHQYHQDIQSLSCALESGKHCQRVRFSHPQLTYGNKQKPVIPVSELASCDDSWQKWRTVVGQKTIILQLTGINELIDAHITPATVHSDNYPLTSGSLWLLDGLETAIQQDGFKKASGINSISFAVVLVIISSLLFNFIRSRVASVLMLVVFISSLSAVQLASLNTIWPLTALLVAAVLPALLILLSRIAMGERRARMVARFIPPQVRSLLLTRSGGHAIEDRQVFATVLMSDVQGFTDITSLLDEPKQVLQLMNTYLDAVTSGLQEKHDAWLEAYIGDLVCYYWPKITDETDDNDLRLKAVRAMVDVYKNQTAFFAEIQNHMQGKVSDEQLKKIKAKIGAGIALTEGEVILGELGPAKGIRKFGPLGDPLNLASRMEGLSRFFNANMLVTADFLPACAACELSVRRLVNVQVKGKTEPVMIYAVGLNDDPDYTPESCARWEVWLATFESNNELPAEELVSWGQDIATYTEWLENGYWDAGRQCFSLSFK